MGGTWSKWGVFIKGGGAASKVCNKPKIWVKTQVSVGVSKLRGAESIREHAQLKYEVGVQG